MADLWKSISHIIHIIFVDTIEINYNKIIVQAKDVIEHKFLNQETNHWYNIIDGLNLEINHDEKSLVKDNLQLNTIGLPASAKIPSKVFNVLLLLSMLLNKSYR